MKLAGLADFKTILKWSLLILVFTPLIVSSTTLFPYIFGKTIFIRLALTIFSVLLTFYFLKFCEEAFRSIDWNRLKNPIFLSFVFFIVLALVSTIFAADFNTAFWGDLERGEGLLILFYMLLFLSGSTLFFEKKDWLVFFKLSLFSGVVIALDSLIHFAENPLTRPAGSFIGNPAFVSVYLLFVTFSAFVVASASRNNRLWSAVSALSISLSAVVLLATKTRGVFVGIFAAILVIAAYSALNGGNRTIGFFGKPVSTRKIGRRVLVSIVFLVLLFAGTKSSPVWQIIPGLDRLAQISLNDATTQTRLINVGVSINAVRPSNVGIARTLLGWGPDNFSQAYNQFYNPTIQKYETTWFDRAHNKLMDVLVMNGVLGLLAYLALWLYVFRVAFSSPRENSPENISRAPLIFFGAAYFIQNLFLFDQVVTYIPLFAFFGYVIYVSRSNIPKKSSDKIKPKELTACPLNKFYIPASATLSVVLITLFVWTCAVPFYQTSLLVSHLRTKEFSFTSENIDKMLDPLNYAQAEIRSNMLFKLSPQSADANVRGIIQQVLAVEEKEPSFIKPFALGSKASAYTSLADFSENQRTELLMRAENSLWEIIRLAPGRQSAMYSLAENYVAQGKFDEAATLADKMQAVEPNSLQAELLWLTIVVPDDWSGERRVFDKVESLFGNKVLSTSVAEFFRTGCDNYIQSALIQRDADNFVGSLNQAIILEKLMAETNKRQVADGVSTELISDEGGQLKSLLNSFQVGGWSAVQNDAQP
jgi:O-antigen ligase